MRVGELRTKLAKLKKEDIAKLAVEFYKLVPKAKKEDYDLDSLINNPQKSKTKTTQKKQESLAKTEADIEVFCENVRNQYYLIPNRIVPKKERSKWRFLVKRWYKELSNIKRSDKDLKLQADLLAQLYKVLCEACDFQYFSAYDPFQSVGVEQSTFFTTLIELFKEGYGKANVVEKEIELVINNSLNRYTLYSYLMKILVATYEVTDLKYKAIEVIEKLIKKNNFVIPKNAKDRYWLFKDGMFNKCEKNNNLAEFGYRFYDSLYEIEEGLDFFDKHYYQDNAEIKLYVLVSILFNLRRKKEIVSEIEKAIVKGIEPRKNLITLLNHIKTKDELPEYMR